MAELIRLIQHITTEHVTAASSFLLVIAAFLALIQISESKKARKNQARRDSLEYSDKIIDYYLNHVSADYDKCTEAASKAGIKIKSSEKLYNPGNLSSSKISDKEMDLIREDLKKDGDFFDKTLILLNSIEKICFMIETNLGEEERVFNCLGGAVPRLVSDFNPYVRLMRKSSLNIVKPYQNLIAVYERWYKKISTLEKEQEHNAHIEKARSLEREIIKSTQPITQPVGTT